MTDFELSIAECVCGIGLGTLEARTLAVVECGSSIGELSGVGDKILRHPPDFPTQIFVR
jgi:hypothetical protein